MHYFFFRKSTFCSNPHYDGRENLNKVNEPILEKKENYETKHTVSLINGRNRLCYTQNRSFRECILKNRKTNPTLIEF